MVQPQEKHTNVRKILTAAGCWLFLKAIDNMGWVFEKLKVDMPLLETGMDILIYTVVLIAAFRLTAGMLEKHYQKG